MTALAADRNTPEREARVYVDPMAASVKVFAGSLGVLDASGNAKPGVTGTGLIARGRVEETVDNTSRLRRRQDRQDQGRLLRLRF